MTSKEALEILSHNWSFSFEFLKENKYGFVVECLEIIKKDLERLEKLESEVKRKSGIICMLESENESLHTEIESLHTKCESLHTEIKSVSDETEEQFKKFLDKENEKRKKVIDILKVKGVQESFLKNTKNVNEYNKAIKHLNYFDELIQEEYELLKEYFI